MHLLVSPRSSLLSPFPCHLFSSSLLCCDPCCPICFAGCIAACNSLSHLAHSLLARTHILLTIVCVFLHVCIFCMHYSSGLLCVGVDVGVASPNCRLVWCLSARSRSLWTHWRLVAACRIYLQKAKERERERER